MSCPIKTNAIAFLKRREVIGDKRIITDYTRFQEYNEALTKKALDKYDVGNGSEQLFTTKSRHFRDLEGRQRTEIVYDTNEKLFDILQEAVTHKEATSVIPLKKGVPYRRVEEIFDENEPEKLVEGLEESFDNTDKLNYLFFGSKDPNISAKEVMQNLINNYSGFDPDIKELVEKAMLLAGATKATIKIVEPYELANQSLMEYKASTNEIRIAPKNWISESTAEVVHAMVHEVVHSVTVGAYRNPITMEQKMFSEFIDASFEFYKTRGVSGDYGMNSPEEFMAEIFTNASFREKLANVDKLAKKNTLTKILDFIRTVLGLTKTARNQKIVNDIVKIAYTPQELKPESLYEMYQYKKADPKDLKSDLSTLNGKLDSVLTEIDVSIKSNIKVYSSIASRTKDEGKAAGISTTVDNLRNLQAQIQNYAKADKIKAVATFVEQMTNYMNHVNNVLNKVDHDNREEVLRIAKQYDEALTTYSVIGQITSTLAYIKEDKTQELVTEEELDNLIEDVKKTGADFGFLKERMNSLYEEAMHEFLNDIKYFDELEYKHKTRLEQEWKDNGSIGDKDSWVSKMMNGRDKEKIDEELKAEIIKLLSDPVTDISGTSVLFNSSLNNSNILIQIFQKLLIEIKNKRIESERKKDLEFRDMFDKLVAEKGTNDIETLYKNLLEFDSTGKQYYKGEYSIVFYETIHKKLIALKKERSKIGEEKGINNQEYTDLTTEIDALQDANYDEVKGKMIVKPKWKNDLTKLSAVENEVREFLIDTIEGARKDTYGEQSLVRYAGTAKFYELPKITKSDTERFWTGKTGGMVKDKWADLTSVRTDDVGYYEANRDGENKAINHLRIHYRDSFANRMSPKHQSLDLMTITRLEYKNGNTFKLRKEVEREMNTIVDIAGRKRYYEKVGSRKVVNKQTGKFNIIPGTESNVHKAMTNMLEQQFYDIMHKSGHKIGPVDLNKAVSLFSSVNSFLALSLNIASGTANVVNANAQLFLESFIKGRFITSKGIAKANKIYGEHLAESLKDLTRPIHKSFVNQISELFDTRGLLNLSEADFMRTDLMKRGLNVDALQVFQDSGEHWVQGVITMAVLDGIKVMNANSDFINKEGKVVSEKDAASLLDMLEADKDGLIQISDKVVYTTHSKTSSIQNGGKEKIDMLLRKKIYDTVGNYTQDQQAELYRHWLGKLGMLYRKYLVPMGVARLKGISTAFKKKEELEDDERSFSYSLQEYEEGTYTSLVRYMATAVKERQFNILSKHNWDKLSDYEKHNVKRATVEIITTMIILPIATMAGAAMLDDDDSEVFWFTIYQLRRLESELSQYTSVPEFFKIMRSPIPTAKLFEDSLEIMYQVFSPLEEYESGYNKGRNKLETKIMKKLPVFKEFRRTYFDMWKFQESTAGF